MFEDDLREELGLGPEETAEDGRNTQAAPEETGGEKPLEEKAPEPPQAGGEGEAAEAATDDPDGGAAPNDGPEDAEAGGEPDEAGEKRPAKEKGGPRRREVDRIAAEARRTMQRVKRENDEFARAMGFEDYGDMKRKVAEAKQVDDVVAIQKGDVDRIDKIVQRKLQESPEIAAARELQERAREAEIERMISQDLQDLNDHFPDCGIRTKEELEAAEHYEDMMQAVVTGMPLWRAYRAYASPPPAKAVGSKDHLQKLGGSGAQGGAAVPKEVLEQYRVLNPDATREEIAAHWKRTHNK